MPSVTQILHGVASLRTRVNYSPPENGLPERWVVVLEAFDSQGERVDITLFVTQKPERLIELVRESPYLCGAPASAYEAFTDELSRAPHEVRHA